MRYFLILCMLFLNACAPLRGTNTGNPSGKPDDNQATFPLPASRTLVVAICGVATKCAVADADNCSSQSRIAPVATELSLNPTVYPNFQTIEVAEGKTLKYQGSALQGCLERMSELTCNDQLVVDAFTPANFQGIASLLKASSKCGEIFKEK